MADPYRTSTVIVPGTPVKPGRAVLIACSAAGVVNLKLAYDTLLPVYAPVGSFELTGYAVKDVVAAGTTATATVSVLD